MPALKRHFHPEFFVQTLLYAFMMLSYLAGLFEEGALILALLLQFFVGLFQVLSGFIHFLIHRSTIHAKYLLGVLIFFIVMGGSFFAIEQIGAFKSFGEVLGLLLVIIIPIGIATWYLNMLTWYYADKYPTRNSSIPQEDLLDDLSMEA